MNRISSTVDRFPQGKLRVRSQKHFYCSKNPSASTFSSSGVKAPDWSSIAEQIQRRAVFDPAAHRSSPVIPGPTKMFQKSLMRLPVPKLEDTCTRYLSAVCPLVDSSTFESTRSRVEAFQKGIGQQLQRELVAMDKKNRHTSYINQDWFHLYLSDRKPLPIHYNPFLTMRNEEAQYKPEALEKAALFIAILTQWYYRYRRGQVAPEAFFFGSSKHYAHQPWFLNLFQYIPSALRTPAIMFSSRFHVFPLDMVQFHNAFATSRIPSCDGVDTIKCFADENPTHVLINYGGRQYTVQVCFSPSDAEDVLQSTANVLTSLKAIVAQHPVPADEEMLRERVEEVGVLTSERRDVWARLRNHLESNPHNALSLKKIDSALFAFSLDLEDPTPGDLAKRSDVIRLARNQMVAPTNRWWDKSFSLLINQSGVVAMNFEHSWGDGVAILRIIVDLYNQYMTNVATYKQAMSNLPSEDLSRRGVSNAWERVSFVLDATTKSSIVSARDRLMKEINNVDYYVNVYPDLGKRNSLFRSEIKPDPFVQLAFQLAWYRLYRNTVSTYESASTSAFLHGRTECIRSATNESKAFTIAMEEGRHKDAALFEMLLKSVRKHAQNSKEAKMGQGIDRHLFALRKMAQRMNVAEPDVFDDASYQTLTLNMMSTSTLASDALMMGGFGPVSPGYGIGYSVADDLILFSISSWKPNAGGPAFGCEAFAQVLYQTVSDLHQLCLRNMKK